MGEHVPFTAIAHLETPPVVRGPILFDGILLAGLGWSVNAERGWTAPEEIHAMALPLARVETWHGWWYAASQVTPWGPEARDHKHRRPALEQIRILTGQGTVNIGAGPDKALRVPFFYRPAMMRLEWTGIGDVAQVARLLGHVVGVGAYVADGWGWVRRWEIRREGPGLDAYRDGQTRHVPVGLPRPAVSAVTTRALPLRPPYYARRNAVPCWQVVR